MPNDGAGMSALAHMSSAHAVEGVPRLARGNVRVPPESPWDPTLALAMARERRAVHEEAVAELLLADLEKAGSPGSFDGTPVPWTS
jgi:hypothetical protein